MRSWGGELKEKVKKVEHSSQARNPLAHIKLPVLIVLIFFAPVLFCSGELWAKPMGEWQAKKAVRGWLKADLEPLGMVLGWQIMSVETFSDGDGQPIYYVVYLQPAGFVIVPADDLVEPIVGFVSGSRYDPSDDNPLGALVSGDLPGRVAVARGLQAAIDGRPQGKSRAGRQVAFEKAGLKARGKWSELQTYADEVEVTGIGDVCDVRIAPLVKSKWGQTWVCYSSWHCYNYYTANNYPSGCVATAMAQLMRYHERPGTAIGVHAFTIEVDGSPQTAYTRGGDGSGGAYNWGIMELDPEFDCGGLTEPERQAIGALCYDSGVSVETSYSPDGSGACMTDVKDALLNTFGYSNAIDGHNWGSDVGTGLNGMVNSNLDAGYPTLFGIVKEGASGGHAVVCDGYGYNFLTLYHHLNMGWDGKSDAWYNLPNIDCSSPGPFDTVYECIYNIYTSGSGEIVSGRVTDTSGDVVIGATVTAERTGGGTYSAATNDSGIYALAKVPSASTYTVSVTKPGYDFTDQAVTTGTSTNDANTSGNCWGVDFVGTASFSPPTAFDANVSARPGLAKTIVLQAGDDGFPDPPGALSYIITSLPNYGTVNDPCAGAIDGAGYTLADYGNEVIYTPIVCYSGPDSFDFKANDGGTEPNGGDSNVATITIEVQQVATAIYETDFEGGLGGFIVDNNFGDGSGLWHLTSACQSSQSGHTTPTALYYGRDDWCDYDAGKTEGVATSPVVSLAGVSAPVLLKFNYFLETEDYSGYDVTTVEISEDGDPFDVVASNSDGNLIDPSGEWLPATVDISAMAGSDIRVRFGFRTVDSGYNAYPGFYIDDVEITGVLSVEPATGDFEPDCDVDWHDLDILGSAWLSEPNDSNWNPACDISEPNDDIINLPDFAALAENWLIGVE